MKESIVCLPVCMILFTAVAGAQARPDFSGTWVPDTNMSVRSGGGGTMRATGGGVARANLGGGGTVEYRITQTDAAITIERGTGGSIQKFVYTFDGVENVNVNNRTTIRSKSRWDGKRLVTEGTETVTTSTGDSISSTFREIRSLGSDGLTVEITRTTERGTTTTSRTYVKKP